MFSYSYQDNTFSMSVSKDILDYILYSTICALSIYTYLYDDTNMVVNIIFIILTVIAYNRLNLFSLPKLTKLTKTSVKSENTPKRVTAEKFQKEKSPFTINDRNQRLATKWYDEKQLTRNISDQNDPFVKAMYNKIENGFLRPN